MTDASQPFTDMSRIWQQHQKNIDAVSRSWQAMADGAAAVANKQREVVDVAIREMSEMAHDDKPSGSPQEMFVRQAELARRTMDAAIAGTRDIAELMQKSGSEALAIMNQRMKESVEEIRSSLERR